MVSYEYHDYPDATQECCLCKRYDCSKEGEKWLHLLTVETDGGYSPAIGHKCLSEIVANGEFAKSEPVVREVVREPSDEEIGLYIRSNYLMPEYMHKDIIERVTANEAVKRNADSPDTEHSPEHHASAAARSKRPRTQTRAK